MRFVLIDSIDRLEPGHRAEGHKLISPNEDYFADHFPGYPVVPGVLLLESLAQLGGRLVESSTRETTGRRVLPMLAKIENTKFIRPVRPGDRLDLACDLLDMSDEAARVTGTARVGGNRVVVATIMYAMLDVSRAGSLLDPDQAASLHAWSDRIWRELKRE
jgi:3-hydroxyacyl-[acyl-carrier-protein] dehydratase